MKKIACTAGTCFLVVLCCAGCLSTINDTRLNISIDNLGQSPVLPLRNFNHDINLYRLGSQIAEQSGFLNNAGQPYGYYTVGFRSRSDKAPNFFIFAWVNGLTLFVPSLIGFPTDLEEFDITAYFYIFDSAGVLIKMYTYTDSFTKLAGLYYGQDPNKKASRIYSALVKSILEQVSLQSAEINYFLEQAGPVSDDNRQAALVEIEGFLKKDASGGRR
jgi:hypothetical protein